MNVKEKNVNGEKNQESFEDFSSPFVKSLGKVQYTEGRESFLLRCGNTNETIKIYF